MYAVSNQDKLNSIFDFNTKRNLMSLFLKCLRNEKILVAYLKGFGISIFVLEILSFCIMKIRKVMTL